MDDCLIIKMKNLKDKFKACLIGAVVGDCLGSEYEFVENMPSREEIETFFNSSNVINFTDDTAMSRSVALSLAVKGYCDCVDIAEK